MERNGNCTHFPGTKRPACQPCRFLPTLFCSLPPLGCIRTSATPQRWVERQKRVKQGGRELRRDSRILLPQLTLWGGSWGHLDGGRKDEGRGPIGRWGEQICWWGWEGAVQEMQTGEREFPSSIACYILSSSTHAISLNPHSSHHHQETSSERFSDLPKNTACQVAESGFRHQSSLNPEPFLLYHDASLWLRSWKFWFLEMNVDAKLPFESLWAFIYPSVKWEDLIRWCPKSLLVLSFCTEEVRVLGLPPQPKVENNE